MCQPAPGPRCASHLRDSLSRNKERRLRAAVDPDVSAEEMRSISEERDTLLFELAGTRSGQADLQTKIDAEQDPELRADLVQYRTRARSAHVAKVEQMRAVEVASQKAREETAAAAPAVSATLKDGAPSPQNGGGKGQRSVTPATPAQPSPQLSPTPTTPQANPSTTYGFDGTPQCSFCSSPAVSYEALLKSSGGEFPRQYRCQQHQRKQLAPNTVSGNVGEVDRRTPAHPVSARSYFGKGGGK